MKKLGLISLALVLALGALGVGYAAWTDEVDITQTVETGSLEIGVRGFYRVVGDTKEVMDVTVTHEDLKFNKEVCPVPGSALFTAGEYAFYESVTIAIDNFYPSVNVLEDYVIGVGGTVPVHLEVTLTVDDPHGLYDCMEITWTKYLIRGGDIFVEANGHGIASEQIDAIAEALHGQQLYGCDVVILYVDKYLLQCEGENMGLSASFTMDVKAWQYNKWSAP